MVLPFALTFPSSNLLEFNRNRLSIFGLSRCRACLAPSRNPTYFRLVSTSWCYFCHLSTLFQHLATPSSTNSFNPSFLFQRQSLASKIDKRPWEKAKDKNLRTNHQNLQIWIPKRQLRIKPPKTISQPPTMFGVTSGRTISPPTWRWQRYSMLLVMRKAQRFNVSFFTLGWWWNSLTVSSDKTMTWWQGAIVMIAENISLGILSLPAVLANVGLIGGLISILALGVFTTYSGYILWQFKMRYPQVC